MYIQLPELESAILSDVHSEALKGRSVTDANEQCSPNQNNLNPIRETQQTIMQNKRPQSAPTRTPNPMRTGV